MNNLIKTSGEVLDDFFDELSSCADIDKEIKEVIIRLYKDGELTEKTLDEHLTELRENSL